MLKDIAKRVGSFIPVRPISNCLLHLYTNQTNMAGNGTTARGMSDITYNVYNECFENKTVIIVDTKHYTINQ